MLVAGCEKRLIPKSGYDSVYAAVVVGSNEDIVETIEAGNNVNSPGPGGEYPIERAVKILNKDKIEILLKNGANPNQQGKNGGIPLNYVIAGRRYDLAELLVGSGADPYLSILNESSPMEFAKEIGDQKMIEILSGINR